MWVAPALFLAGCGGKEEAKKGAGSAAPAVPVVVAKVEQRTVPVYTEATARTDANDTVQIRARVAAYLQAIHFTEGTLVKKGQLLFSLDKREFEAQLNQAKAALAKAEATCCRPGQAARWRRQRPTSPSRRPA